MFKRNLLIVLCFALALTACTGKATPTQSPSLPQPYPGPLNAYPAPGAGFNLYAPKAGDEKLTRAEVQVDLATSQLVIVESDPIQVTLMLKGSLPSPCHRLRVVVQPANANKEINIEVYALADPQEVCTQVLTPLDASVVLGSVSDGKYTVIINGQVFKTIGE
jgi:hypothetical protein